MAAQSPSIASVRRVNCIIVYRKNIMLALIEDQAHSLYKEGIRINSEIKQLDERISEMQELIDELTMKLSRLRKKTAHDIIRQSRGGDVVFIRLKLTGVAHSVVLFINFCSLVAIIFILLFQTLYSSIMQ